MWCQLSKKNVLDIMEEVKKMLNVKDMRHSILIKWIVTFVLSVICFFLPNSEYITSQVKIYFAVTIFGLALAAFELLPVLSISIIMPALWIFLGVAPAEIVLSSWTGTTALMIVGALFMAASLESCGLLKRVAFIILCKAKGSYFILLLGVMLCGVLMNILTSGRGYIIMGALAAGLCLSLNGMQKNLGAGLAAAVMAGGCTSHIFTYQASGWGPLLGLVKEYIPIGTITPLSIILHNWPMIFICVLLTFIISKIFKPEQDLTAIQFFELALKNMGPISRREKANLLMLLIILLYIFTAGWHKLDVNLGFAIFPWMVCLPGINGADEKTVRKVNMEIVFFVMACMSIGTVGTSLGLDAVLSQLLSVVMQGSSNPFIIIGLIFIVAFLLNFLMTPLAIFALSAVPICAMVTELGLEPTPFVYALNACVEAILLPYEYVPYLIVFSFGMISMQDFIKYNIIRSVLVFAGIEILLIPYWMILGLF